MRQKGVFLPEGGFARVSRKPCERSSQLCQSVLFTVVLFRETNRKQARRNPRLGPDAFSRLPAARRNERSHQVGPLRPKVREFIAFPRYARR